MSQRVNQLDLLRGIALMGVLAVHTMQEFPSILNFMDTFYYWGRYGVQLFFAISGYTMMMMYTSYSKNWQSTAKVFYIKRILRLYPLFFIAAFLYLPLYIEPSYFNPDGTQVSDVIRVLTLTGGLDPHLLNAVVPGGWSIVNEIYFYIFFPLMFLAIGKVNIYFISFIICLCNLVLIGFAYYIYEGKENYLIMDFLYRNIFNQIIIFYAGIEAYRNIVNGKSEFWKLWTPIFIVGIILEFTVPRSMLINSAIISAICYLILLYLFKVKPMSNLWLEKIGRVTYTGYIIHFAIIHFMVEIINYFTEKNIYFEIMYPIILICTIFIARTLSPITEQYWQNIANTICNKKFKRLERV